MTAGILLIFSAIATIEFWQYAKLEGPAYSDFFGLWSWSRFVATEGTSALYDPAAMHRFQQALDPLYADQHYPFLYPPTYLLFIWPLAHLPLAAARIVWSAATLAAFLFALSGTRWHPRLLVAGVVAPATVLCLICGQNGLLTAALMIGGLRCAASRPLIAGVLLGLLTYKPHLAALIPIALVTARLWPTLCVAAATAALCVVASSLSFGGETWAAWFGAQQASWTTVDAFIGAHLTMIPTAGAALRQVGLESSLVLAGQSLATIGAAGALWIAWRRGPSTRSLAAVPVAALMATPYAFLYDLPMVSGAALLALADGTPPLAVAFLGSALLLPQLMFDLQSPGRAGAGADPAVAARADGGRPIVLPAPPPMLPSRALTTGRKIMRVGVAGLGKMGAAMAARLKDAGADVVVWNRSRERAEATGLPIADTPKALAAQVDTVVSMLFDDSAVMQVYRGASGLIEAARGKLFIEMSTVRPMVHEHLATDVRNTGGIYVECPVSGSIGPARAGKLLGLAGGEAMDVTSARPVLDMLCRRVAHVGKIGAGSSVKLAVNLPLLVFWQAFGEANALIRHLKLDPEFIVELFTDTSGGANVLKTRGAALAAALAGKDPGGASFDVDSIRKDLKLMLAEARDHDYELPLSERTLDLFDQAAAAGLGARDCTVLPAFWAAKADHKETD